MDVWGVYCGAGEAGSYGGTIRSPYYRDYEQFPYGSLEHNKNTFIKDPYSKVQEKFQQVKTEKLLKKDCPFCKEHKKRPLINYMRKRQSRKHHESICEEEAEHEMHEHEEEEEEEEEENEVVEDLTAQTSNK